LRYDHEKVLVASRRTVRLLADARRVWTDGVRVVSSCSEAFEAIERAIASVDATTAEESQSAEDADITPIDEAAARRELRLIGVEVRKR